MAENKFIPKPGQADFTNIRYCPVINCLVQFEDELLLQQRSSTMRLYPSYWSGVSGFLDSQDSIEDKAYEELYEETGINKQNVKTIEVGQVFIQEAPEYDKTWIVFPVLVTLNAKQQPKTNWETTDMQWFKHLKIRELNLLPGFNEVLTTFFDDTLNL